MQSNIEFETKVQKAVFYFFAEGWSLIVSMRKAGIKNRWWENEQMRNHPDVIRMREVNRKDFYNKKRF